MGKKTSYIPENPIQRMVIDGGVFYCEQHLRHAKLEPFENQIVLCDPNFDVILERITSFTFKTEQGLPICEVDFPPKGEDDG